MSNYYQLHVERFVDVYGGPSYGTEYSLENACRKCGSGAMAVGPRVLRSFRAPKQPAFWILNGEVLVRPEIADILGTLGVDCLAEVVDVETRRPLPYFELRPSKVLPPFSQKTAGIERESSCRACGRDGFFAVPHTDTVLVYQGEDIGALGGSPVMATFERFGNSVLREPFHDSVFACPAHVVDQSVYEALLEKASAGLHFTPVLLL